MLISGEAREPSAATLGAEPKLAKLEWIPSAARLIIAAGTRSSPEYYKNIRPFSLQAQVLEFDAARNGWRSKWERSKHGRRSLLVCR